MMFCRTLRTHVFSCAACERRFDTQILLEYHKDQFAHWTEEDLAAYWYVELMMKLNR